MSMQEILYLALVIVGFVIFGVALAYADWADKSH